MTEPKTAADWKIRGNELFSQDDVGGAVEAYSKAIELDPKNAIFYGNRAAAYTFQRKFAEAIADAEKAINLNKVYPKGWIRLGIAEYSRGDYAKAKTAFEEAKNLAKNPEDIKDKAIRKECDEYIKLCEEEQRKLTEDVQHLDIHEEEKRDAMEALEVDASGYQPKDMVEKAPAPECCTKPWFELYFHAGNVCNMISVFITIIGFIMKYSGNPTDNTTKCKRKSCAYIWVLSLGLFAAAGGITNWAAIKMLFDKIPYVYGSGIIPARFREIREVVKGVIMKNFFDEVYLGRYFKDQILAIDIEEKLEKFLQSDNMEKIVEAVFGDDAKTFLPMIKPYALKTGLKMAPLIKMKIREMDLVSDLKMVQGQIDAMLTAKMEELTPDKVKLLLEEIMRKHLFWLVVWGNIFGGILGVISAALPQ